jgi:hypothetical protein
MITKFQVEVQIDTQTGELELVPTMTLADWLKRNNLTIKQIKFDQEHRPPYWHQCP